MYFYFFDTCISLVAKVMRICVYSLQTTWRKPFTELILIWMDVISKKFNEWVLQSLDIEEVHIFIFKHNSVC